MSKETEALVQEFENPQVEQTVEETPSTFTAIVRKLEKDYGKAKKCIVKNVNYEIKDSYTRVTFTIRNEVPGFVYDKDTDTWKMGNTNLIYATTYALAGTLKENDDLAWLGNVVLTKPEVMNLLFSGAEIHVIQQSIAADEAYKNPFSKDAEEVSKDREWVVSHIVGIKLSQVGQRVYDKLMDKILDF